MIFKMAKSEHGIAISDGEKIIVVDENTAQDKAQELERDLVDGKDSTELTFIGNLIEGDKLTNRVVKFSVHLNNLNDIFQAQTWIEHIINMNGHAKN